MLHRRSVIAVGFLFGASACVRSSDVAIPTGTKLIILRHADRTGEDLNDKGRARAQALVEALDGTAIDAIYSPSIQRNLDTAAPLAAARGLEIQRIAPYYAAERLMEVGASKTIVWIGNKDNLSAIWEALSLPEPPPLDYGDLYFVELATSGSPIVTRTFFGPR